MIKVIPFSSSSQIVGFENKILKIRINSVPEKNKANRELLRFLAKTFNLSLTNLKIIKGEKSSLKTIHIHFNSKENLELMVSKLLSISY